MITDEPHKITSSSDQRILRLEEALASAEENKYLLELQLQQAQEELSLAFSKISEREFDEHKRTNFIPHFWMNNFPGDFWVDLRQAQVVENWYEPEIDGRWTGPGVVSSILLPPFPEAKYLVEIEIVGAIDEDLVGAVEVFTENGFVAAPNLQDSSFSAHGLLVFTLLTGCEAATNPWKFSIRVPRTLSPSDFGGDDYRMLGLRIRTIRFVREW
jgi:hypothetical protein